jgi:hypothetical protein
MHFLQGCRIVLLSIKAICEAFLKYEPFDFYVCWQCFNMIPPYVMNLLPCKYFCTYLRAQVLGTSCPITLKLTMSGQNHIAKQYDRKVTNREPPSFQIRPIVHVWRSGLLWMLWIGGPQDSREFILHQESSLNFRSIQTQKLRHFDEVQFLVSSAVQSSNSHKCKKNVVSVKGDVQCYPRFNK